MTTEQRIVQQAQAERSYGWTCECGHAYYTALNVPGMCPLHAAAPDMLAALKGWVAVVESDPSMFNHGGGPAMHAARAVISKAEGR